MSGVPQFLDVTVRLRAGMPFYPGNPEFELQPIKRIAEGGSSNVSRLVLGTPTGTHVDAPRHFIDDGAATEQLPLEVLSTGRAETGKGGGQGCTTTHS
jgi:arylformamidase